MNSKLKGLNAPPLVDGRFCIDTYREWMTVNNKWPWKMKYDDYKKHLDKDNMTTGGPLWETYNRNLARLCRLKEWFYQVGRAIDCGYDVPEEVIKDYKRRMNAILLE